MRLIDGDELRLSHCKECTLYPDKCLKDKCDVGCIYHINVAPTIQAIPIDWLLSTGMMMIDNESRTQLFKLINYWRKENGD